MAREIEKRKPDNQADKAKRKRNRELNDLRIVSMTPEGRRLIWRVLTEGKVFHDGYVHGDGGFGTTFNSGRRSVGVWLLAEVMEAKPDLFMQMQKEHASEVKREEMELKEMAETKDMLEVYSEV